MAKSLAIRVDDRLIHGQVVTQWIRVFKAQKIVVIDDKVAVNKMRQSVLKMAAPSDVKVAIYSVDKAVEKWEKISSAIRTYSSCLGMFSRLPH